MKNNSILKFIISIILSFLSVSVIFSMTNNISTFENSDHIIILRYILSSCMVIIGLIIIFGFAILKKINDLGNN